MNSLSDPRHSSEPQQRDDLLACFDAGLAELDLVLAEARDQLPPTLSGPDGLAAGVAELRDAMSLISAYCVDYDIVAGILRDHAEGLADLLCPNAAPMKPRRLVVGPCPDYLGDLVPLFKAAFDEVILVDSYKAGQDLRGLKIIDPVRLGDIGEDCACFIATITPGIADIYRGLFPAGQCVTSFDLLARAPGWWLRDETAGELARIGAAIQRAEQPVVLVSPTFSTTWSPMIVAMQRQGRDVFLIGMGDVHDPRGYSTLASKDVPVTDSVMLSLPEMLTLIGQIPGALYLINSEGFFHPQWDTRRSVLCYAFGMLLAHLAGTFGESRGLALSKSVLFLYDPIKPVIENPEYGALAAFFYERMLRNADGLLYNSATEEIGAFLANVFDLKNERAHFFRYSVAPSMLRERLEEERHIVSISAVLDEFYEPSRSRLRGYMRQVVEQRIHLHYYGDYETYPRILEFGDELPDDLKRFFHVHAVIRDQQALVDEIQQYHAGWVVHDQQVFWRIVTAFEDQFSRDIFQLFPSVTIPTSAMTYGAAGLPIIINRCMRGSIRQFPPGCALAIELSEIRALGRIMEQSDWPVVMQTARKNRHLFTAAHHAPRLERFFAALMAD